LVFMLSAIEKFQQTIGIGDEGEIAVVVADHQAAVRPGIIFITGREFALFTVANHDDAAIGATVLDPVAGVDLFAGKIMEESRFHNGWVQRVFKRDQS